MVSTLKTPTSINTTFLVDGQSADASDVITPFFDTKAAIDTARERISVSSADTHMKTLDDALQAGSNITLTKINPSGDEKIQIATQGQLKVSSADTQHNYLNAKLAAGSGLSTEILNPAGNEVLRYLLDSKLVNLLPFLTTAGKLTASGVDSQAAPNGYVLTANGSGGASFESAATGAQPVDITVTAGEALALRDAVYINPADFKAYKIDVDASPIRCGAIRGIVIEASGIPMNNTGAVRILGQVSGFSSLTAFDDVWASTTAGGITQAKPTLTAGGGQRAIVWLGFAVSATAIMVWPRPAMFMKRESLANNATLTVEHYVDENAHDRKFRSYVSTTVAATSFASYGSGNQDVDVQLRGQSGAGGTTDTLAAFDLTTSLGDSTDLRRGQSFQIAAGIFSQFTVHFGANTGSPAGTVTWEIRPDDGGGLPTSTVIASGTFTPTPNAVNTVPVTNGPFLLPGTTYHLIFRSTGAQTAGNAWTLARDDASTYANGQAVAAIGTGAWTGISTSDLKVTMTTSALAAKDRLAQSFQVGGSSLVDTVQLYLKKIGAPVGTLTLRIETDSSGSPSGTLVAAGATATVSESSLSTSYGMISFDLTTNPTLNASTTYWLVLETSRSASNTDYVLWGADASSPGYASGEMKFFASSTWSAESKDAIFDVLGVTTIFDEPCVVGRWSGGTRDVAIRFDDGLGASGDTKTTFKNVSGGTLDVTAVVELY
jgi:hypothetical protein